MAYVRVLGSRALHLSGAGSIAGTAGQGSGATPAKNGADPVGVGRAIVGHVVIHDAVGGGTAI